jgi:hypothetical protein
MVLSVFASELHLKCLLCIEKGVVPAKHDLKVLFEGLNVATRHELDICGMPTFGSRREKWCLIKFDKCQTGKTCDRIFDMHWKKELTPSSSSATFLSESKAFSCYPTFRFCCGKSF